MDRISNFNPIKRYENLNLVTGILDILKYESEQVCFYGDNNCYFYAPLRRILEPNVSFTDKRYYLLLSMLKDNVDDMQEIFQAYSETWNINLISHFESKLIRESFPHLIAYYTFVLSLYSRNINGNFSNYIGKEDGRLAISLRDMLKFNFRNEAYFEKIPENQLIVSIEHDLKTDGILISKRKKDYPLIREVGKYKFYQMEGDK